MRGFCVMLGARLLDISCLQTIMKMEMKKHISPIFIVLFLLVSCQHNRSITEPEPPPPPIKRMVTFEGRAFLDGQPEPVNALHLPLHYDIQIVSYLPGDSASYDTVYTDSTGVYISTKLRQDGTYLILSQYPYYTIDTVQVEVKDGQVVGHIPELHSKRLLKIEIFPDSTVYHSLQSQMFFDEFITNLNCDSTKWIFPCDSLVSRWPGAVSAPTWYKELLIPKDDLSIFLFAADPNLGTSGCLPACRVHMTFRTRLLINFSNYLHDSPRTGDYYLYLAGHVWPENPWSPHYQKSRHWWFKVMEPSEVRIELR